MPYKKELHPFSTGNIEKCEFSSSVARRERERAYASKTSDHVLAVGLSGGIDMKAGTWGRHPLSEWMRGWTGGCVYVCTARGECPNCQSIKII